MSDYPGDFDNRSPHYRDALHRVQIKMFGRKPTNWAGVTIAAMLTLGIIVVILVLALYIR